MGWCCREQGDGVRNGQANTLEVRVLCKLVGSPPPLTPCFGVEVGTKMDEAQTNMLSSQKKMGR